MRQFVFAWTVVLSCAFGLSLPERAHAADLSVTTTKKIRVAKSTSRRVIVRRDPCHYIQSHRRAVHPLRYDYSAYHHLDRANVAYFPGDAYNGGYCLSLATGPRFHPGWAWGW